MSKLEKSLSSRSEKEHAREATVMPDQHGKRAALYFRTFLNCNLITFAQSFHDQ
jgi:hypothetical protein